MLVVKIPTAIFHGVQDKICEFALAIQMQKGIKNSYIIRFENSGHGFFLEELEKFNAELVKFLQIEDLKPTINHYQSLAKSRDDGGD